MCIPGPNTCNVMHVAAVTIPLRFTPTVKLICSIATPTLERTLFSRLLITRFHDVTGQVDRESSW